MFRPIFSLACAVVFAAPLVAQDKPTPEQEKALAGAWKFDQSQSDTVTGNALSFRANVGVGSKGANLSGGGGKRGGGRSAPAEPAAPSAADSAAVQQAGANELAAVRDPHMALILNDINPGDKLTVTANDSTVTLTNAAGQASTFKADGRKREEAQMDGSVIETQAEWNNGTLTITRGVAGTASLKREFKAGKDGNMLEVKETADAGGGKVQKKLVFLRQ